MKKISLKIASDLYDELKFYKKFGDNVCIYLHDNTVKVGYDNNYGASNFIKNNETRMLVINKYKTSILLEDYYKKDACKIIQALVNEVIEEYKEVIEGYDII